MSATDSMRESTPMATTGIDAGMVTGAHPTIVPRAGIMEITPYVGGESKVAGANRVIKLSSNENPLGPSPKALEAAQESIR
ncbi:MAG: hypothetical protein AAF565_07775, partial [Pseudomonadota bacterium]